MVVGVFWGFGVVFFLGFLVLFFFFFWCVGGCFFFFCWRERVFSLLCPLLVFPLFQDSTFPPSSTFAGEIVSLRKGFCGFFPPPPPPPVEYSFFYTPRSIFLFPSPFFFPSFHSFLYEKSTRSNLDDASSSLGLQRRSERDDSPLLHPTLFFLLFPKKILPFLPPEDWSAAWSGSRFLQAFKSVFLLFSSRRPFPPCVTLPFSPGLSFLRSFLVRRRALRKSILVSYGLPANVFFALLVQVG